MIRTSFAALCLAAVSLSSQCQAMSYLTPSNVTAACTIASAAEQTVLADEALANQVAGKQVVHTGTTATIANLTPQLCAQIGGVIVSISNAALANAATIPAPAAAPAK